MDGNGARRRCRRRQWQEHVDARGSAGAARTALQRPDVPRARRAPPALRPERRAGLDAALDQDRRLPRGLRLLPAEHPLRHRRRARGAAWTQDDVVAQRARGAGGRRHALLHGRGLAQPEGPRPREGRRDGRGRGRARPRDLRDARHADAGRRRRGSRTPASTTTTTTSTRRRPTTARSSRRAPTRIASTRSRPCATPASRCAAAASSAWARRPRRPRRLPAHARDARPAPRERADQQARAGAGHAARRRGTRSIRSNSCASSRSRAS